MATYAIGDVQGCFDGLTQLLDSISFDAQRDTLIFLGDVVNRGSQSLQTLEFIYNTNSKMVLGNHDYHLLACYFKVAKPNRKDTFLDVLNAPNNTRLIDFLVHQNIVFFENTALFVHAGIPHIWDKDKVLEMNNMLTRALIHNPKKCIQNTYGNQERYQTDNQDLQMQYGVNALMRMRFCDENSVLNFSQKTTIAPDGFAPWFDFKNEALREYQIYFGHWSALVESEIKQPSNIYPMDTGYIWGGNLSCVRLEDNAIFSVKNNIKQ